MLRPDGGWPIMSEPRTQRYTRIPVALRYRRDAWACRCALPRYKKHREPWLCAPAHELAAWRLTHPEVTTSDRNARCLLWLARTFGR